jgi:hypothetical protein
MNWPTGPEASGLREATEIEKQRRDVIGDTAMPCGFARASCTHDAALTAVIFLGFVVMASASCGARVSSLGTDGGSPEGSSSGVASGSASGGGSPEGSASGIASGSVSGGGSPEGSSSGVASGSASGGGSPEGSSSGVASSSASGSGSPDGSSSGVASGSSSGSGSPEGSSSGVASGSSSGGGSGGLWLPDSSVPALAGPFAGIGPGCAPINGTGAGTFSQTSCFFSFGETCNGTMYQATCACPQGACSCVGLSTQVIGITGCPACPGAAEVFKLCGFPYDANRM